MVHQDKSQIKQQLQTSLSNLIIKQTYIFDMSLFQLKQLWSCQISKTEQFDYQHLATGYIDSHQSQRIIIGSFSGTLRIYKPSLEQYKPTDLIFEATYPEPIIQVKVGNFMQQQSIQNVGLLFTKKLIILTFVKTANESLTVIKNQEFALPGPCFSFHGNPLLSTSLNSELYYLNPPSKIQIKASSPIYTSVVSKTNFFYYMDGEELAMVNAGIQQWRVLVGEVTQLHLYQENVKPEIICVGQKCVWIVQYDGTIMQSKLIENQVSCSAIVNTPQAYNIILGTFSSHLLIYNQSKLIWATKCQYVPVSIKILNVNSKKGLIGLLSDSGNLDVCYLGTDAPVQAIDQRPKAIELKDLDKQIEKLESFLESKSTQGNKVSTTNNSNSDTLKFQVRNLRAISTDDYIQNQQKLFSVNEKVKSLQGELLLQINANRIYDIKIIFRIPSNLYMENTTISIQQITSKSIQNFVIYALNDKFCYSDTVEVGMTYYVQTSRGKSTDPKTCSLEFKLPLTFQCVRVGTLKNQKPNHKIILVANKQIPNFSSLFNDVELIESANNPTTIVFKMSSNSETSIVAAKSSSKYKIQSDYYEGICLILIEFIKRAKSIKVELSIETVPLEELFIITQSHYKSREKLKNMTKILEQSSLEFRLIQKRILSKMKDKASDLNSLDIILDRSYKQLLANCNLFQQTQEELNIINHQLMISIKIVCELLFLRGKTTDHNRKLITGVLNVDVYTTNWGWEQQLIVNSSILLKKKITATDTQNIEYEKIKKILLWIVDKTAKGQIN